MYYYYGPGRLVMIAQQPTNGYLYPTYNTFNYPIAQNDYMYGQPYDIVDVSDDPEAQLITDPQQLQMYTNLLQVQSFLPLIVLEPEEIKENYSTFLREPQEVNSPIDQYAGDGPSYIGGIGLEKRDLWLFGFKVPEIKVSTCHKVFKTPFGKFKIPYPCMYTRNSEIHFWATIWYPYSFNDYIKQKIHECFIEAKGAAKGAGVTAFIGAFSGGPKAAAAAGLTAAFTAFKITFTQCLSNIPSNFRNDIKYQIKWEQIRTSDWKRV
ncbi:hypothetical protein ACNA06_08965 [Lysinibacillus sp. RSDA_15]|uniref:hypothetical protein n=1 Tax=Lysinibacillus sp. RSDA_15 TaxID=3391421 RepID=UPI003A4D1CEB